MMYATGTLAPFPQRSGLDTPSLLCLTQLQRWNTKVFSGQCSTGGHIQIAGLSTPEYRSRRLLLYIDARCAKVAAATSPSYCRLEVMRPQSSRG